MDLDQIRARLQGCLQSSDLQASLMLSRTTFDTVRMNSLIDTYYGGTSLVIDQASIEPPNEGDSAVTVNGVASFQNIPNLPVKATFLPAQDGVDATLQYQLPPTWKFSTSRPFVLKGVGIL